jgi:hypothetical protein
LKIGQRERRLTVDGGDDIALFESCHVCWPPGCHRGDGHTGRLARAVGHLRSLYAKGGPAGVGDLA